MSGLSLTLDTPELARHYETVSVDRQFEAGKVLIERLSLRSAERVFDIGCGTGLLAEYVAQVVGPSGRVLGIDPLPLRIEIARRKTAANLKFEVGDAYALNGHSDASFDVVYLNAVFHWLPEKLGPLRQFRRLLVPGGRLGLTTGLGDKLGTVQEVRKRVLAREPYAQFPEASAGAAQRVTLAELRGLFEQTGFELSSLEVLPNQVIQPSANAAIEFSQASSFGNFLGHLPAHLRRTARAEIAHELEAFRVPDGILLQGARILAIAKKSVYTPTQLG
jgi:ubiquinone/menaquinone biosynthesis C-methylase UbiE